MCLVYVCCPGLTGCFCSRKILHTLLKRTVEWILDSHQGSEAALLLPCVTFGKWLPVPELHSLLCEEGPEFSPSWSCSVHCKKWYVCHAQHAGGLGCGCRRPLRAPFTVAQGLKPNQFYLQTQLQGWFQLCPLDLAGYPQLHLAPGFCPQNCQHLGIHPPTHCHAPIWRQCP